MANRRDEDQQFCYFCGKSTAEVDQIVTGGAANICDECIMSCYELITGNRMGYPKSKKKKEDDQLVDGVNECHAADGGRAEVRDHHGVHGADERGEHLLYYEGDKQLPQVAV